LPKVNDEGTKRHQTPLEVWMDKVATGWEPLVLSNDDIAHVFRPREERTVVRGEVRLFNNRYFSPELEEFHGLNVHVAYDIHDPNRVWVFDMITGELIAPADWNANESKYFPDSVLNQAREKRAQGRLNRAMKRVDEIEAERTGHMAFEQQAVIEQNAFNLFEQLNQPAFQQSAVVQKQALGPSQEIQPPANQYESLSPTGRFALYQDCQHNQDGALQHKVWMRTYPLTKEFKYFRSLEEQKRLNQENGIHEKEKYS
jgi:putative transposase